MAMLEVQECTPQNYSPTNLDLVVTKVLDRSKEQPETTSPNNMNLPTMHPHIFKAHPWSCNLSSSWTLRDIHPPKHAKQISGSWSPCKRRCGNLGPSLSYGKSLQRLYKIWWTGKATSNTEKSMRRTIVTSDCNWHQLDGPHQQKGVGEMQIIFIFFHSILEQLASQK